MSEPSLALQKMIYARLIAAPGITGGPNVISSIYTLVPAANIFDRNRRPERLPCIIIGDGVTAYGNNLDSFHDKVVADIHIWTTDGSLSFLKQIAGAVRTALRAGPWITEGFNTSNVSFVGFRMVRDPISNYSHGILSLEAIMQELAC